jgi:hypothetical protein
MDPFPAPQAAMRNAVATAIKWRGLYHTAERMCDVLSDIDAFVLHLIWAAIICPFDGVITSRYMTRFQTLSYIK